MRTTRYPGGSGHEDYQVPGGSGHEDYRRGECGRRAGEALRKSGGPFRNSDRSRVELYVPTSRRIALIATRSPDSDDSLPPTD